MIEKPETGTTVRTTSRTPNSCLELDLFQIVNVDY